ncbi:MAG TPA: glucodextranase DOMON-like domain-containing protein [Thermoanaerobaculaceae bacterium]|nr:glucodextranase DOMON-like domain-containing protein [Thermoanaerobaculaceae bacterium]
MRVPTFVLVVSLSVLAVATVSVGAEKPIFTITDPRGDDYGDGSLIYPQRDDIERGELDIVSFSAFPDKAGTIFEVAFAKPVRKPERRPIDELGTQLDSVAKLGFYNFNLDIYIDTDRVAGSGSTEMLPGRRATIDPAYAWEKVVCLTPRPGPAAHSLRAVLERQHRLELRKRQGRVTDEDEKQIAASVARDVSSDIFFPTLVWVVGNRVRFFVPASFLGGVAKDTWAYVVADSVADLQETVDLSAAIGKDPRAPSLMIVPVEAGRGPAFVGGGNSDDTLQPPLIDIIVPPGVKQEDVLKDYDLRVDRPVRLPGVVPANSKP